MDYAVGQSGVTSICMYVCVCMDVIVRYVCDIVA